MPAKPNRCTKGGIPLWGLGGTNADARTVYRLNSVPKNDRRRVTDEQRPAKEVTGNLRKSDPSSVTNLISGTLNTYGDRERPLAAPSGPVAMQKNGRKKAIL